MSWKCTQGTWVSTWLGYPWENKEFRSSWNSHSNDLIKMRPMTTCMSLLIFSLQILETCVFFLTNLLSLHHHVFIHIYCLMLISVYSVCCFLDWSSALCATSLISNAFLTEFMCGKEVWMEREIKMDYFLCICHVLIWEWCVYNKNRKKIHKRLIFFPIGIHCLQCVMQCSLIYLPWRYLCWFMGLPVSSRFCSFPCH